MAMILLPPDFKEFLQLLNRYEVEYLLIGGYAVGYHGYPRATGDMDVWVATTPANAAKLLTVLSDFGFGATGATVELFQQPQKVIRMGNPPLRIEVLTSISGVDFATCYAARIIDTVDGIAVNLISREHLKANKLASGRTKDHNDLEHLP